MERVLVIGATGDQGHPLLRRLIEEGYTPVAALRNPDALKGTEFDSVETVQADLMDQSSMINAAKGMSYIASHLPFTFELETAQIFGDNIAAAAKANQVKRVVFNTSCYVHDTDLDIGGHDGRRRIEAAIIGSGVPYVIFEPKVFMDNFTRVWAKPGVVLNDTLGYPAGPALKVNWICLDDVAAFMVEAIKQTGAPSGRYPIGGPEALTGDEVAQRLTQAAGREIRFKSLKPDEFASAMSLLVTGSAEVEPGSIYDRMAEFYRWYNTQPVSPLIVDLESVLSIFPVEPTPLLDWAKTIDWNDPNDPALAIRMAGMTN